MPITIFFSWQSDTPPLVGRNFIERAIQQAVNRVGQDAAIENAVRDKIAIDRDTKDVPGSPPIVDTIFRKIDQAGVFVPDLTFVGTRSNGRPTPNPNVLIEYGWALKPLGYGRIVPVMNTAFGEPTPESMPFNMAHLRHPITYCCPGDATHEHRQQIRGELSRTLEHALRNVFDSAEFKESLPKAPEEPAFRAKEPEDGQARFKPRKEPVGVSVDFPNITREIKLSSAPAIWLRVMPVRDPGCTWTISELEQAATRSGRFLLPISSNWSGFDYVRSHEGFGIFSISGNDRTLAKAIVFIFTTGALEFSKGTHFQAGQRMGRRRALFDSTNVQDGPIEVHLVPAKVHQLRRT
jgi:hypothetical protein